jgi:hypothetical protein
MIALSSQPALITSSWAFLRALDKPMAIACLRLLTLPPLPPLPLLAVPRL